MSRLFVETLNMSLSAICVAAFVMPLRILLKKAPKKYAYMLWAVVFFRLVCPFHLQTPLSVMPVQTQNIPRSIIYSDSPYIQGGLRLANDTVSAVIEKTLSPGAPINSWRLFNILFKASVYIWLAVAAALLLYGAVSYLRMRKRLRTAIRVHDGVYETDLIKTPFVFGIIRPRIYIPTGLREKELMFIIQHERVHIKRLDYLIKPVLFAVAAIHWFNPVIWASYSLMSKDIELSADEYVMKCFGEGIRGEYSLSLLALSVKNHGYISAPAFGGNGVKERVKNVLGYRRPALWVSAAAIAAVAAASVALAGNRSVARVGLGVPAETAPSLSVTVTAQAKSGKNEPPTAAPSYKAARISLLSGDDSSGYNPVMSITDPSIVASIDYYLSSLPASPDKAGSCEGSSFQIEVANGSGVYACSLYYDAATGKVCLVKDGNRYDYQINSADDIYACLQDAHVTPKLRGYAESILQKYGKILNFNCEVSDE